MMEKEIKKLSVNEKIIFLIELYEKERQRLITVIKPYLQKQEYGLAKEYQDKLNSINEFIGQLKIITFEEENRFILTTFDGVSRFIVLNKNCLSIKEIAVIIGECNNTTYIDLDRLTVKLKNIVESKIN